MDLSAATLTPAQPDQDTLTVYLAFLVNTPERGYVGISRTLAGAQQVAEDSDEAVPYFSDPMVWDTEPTIVAGARQWRGQVRTTPYGSPNEFAIRESVV